MERKQKQQIIKFITFSFKDWKKRKTNLNTIDFIKIKGQQSLLENSIDPTEIKKENSTVKNMIEKYKKNGCKVCT